MTVERSKGDNISSVNMVPQFTFNLYFQCCYMYIVILTRPDDTSSRSLVFRSLHYG